MIKDIDSILNEDSDTLLNLSPFDCLEYDIAQWLLQHKEGLQAKLNTLYRPASHLFPPALLDVYLHQYSEGATHIIQQEISNSFNLDPETLQTRINKDFIKLIAKDLLIPNI